MLKGWRRSGTVTLACGISFPGSGPDGEVSLLVRPNRVVRDPTHAGLNIEAHISATVFLGEMLKVTAILNSGEKVILHDHGFVGAKRYKVGEVIKLGWSADDHRVIDEHKS